MGGGKLVIIVNGKPRAGKDTFAQLLNRYENVYKISSIDKIKQIAIDCGWTGKKTEKDRKFLSDLKMLVSDYSDVIFDGMLEKVMDFYSDEIHERIMVIDIREPEEIERAKTIFDAITLFIKNDNVEDITSNEADANVENYEYDYYITNNGIIEEFDQNIMNFYYSVLLKLIRGI